MVIESLVLFALLMGLLSALSLPLGTLTTLVWTPGDRATAWLMAFGAGALLSAVTIDLFAPAIHKGLFFDVALGAVIGSLFYLLINHQLNKQGGFLRKTATMIQFFRNQQKIQRQKLRLSFNRLTFFNQLIKEDQYLLFQHMQRRDYKANSIIFHSNDLLNEFYIIHKGVVNLREPKLGLKKVDELTEFDAFGHLGFFASMQSSLVAQASEDVTLWVLNRSDFNKLLALSPSLFESLQDYFKESSELEAYLKKYQHMDEAAAQEQLQGIQKTLVEEKRLPFARESRELFESALERLKASRRFDLLDSCQLEIYSLLASKVKLRQARAGETLFANKSEADRLYLLESGSIELIDPKKHSMNHEVLSPGDFFGGMAFVVGGLHSSTAVACSDVTFWVLEKSDFLQLLNDVAPLYEKLQAYLKENCVHEYLIHEQSLSETKAQKWVKESVKKLVPGHMPSLAGVNQRIYQHNAAYVAIWLGIFLDGIPESLMIGVHTSNGHMISISLIAAIFISNYPEALSSSASMKEQGIPFNRILFAWTSLMILTGLGAALGSVMLSDASPQTFALIGGMAAGAMLTVIAETMLPEAYTEGGSITGFVTLMGFLCAVLFKVFDSTI